MKHNLYVLGLIGLTTLCAQPQAPSALQAATATKTAVGLIWVNADSSTTAYRVERRFLGDSTYATIGSPTARTFTDSNIDAMATYVYRVRAADAAANFSGPSNEITVGPPPVGVSLVSAFRPELNFVDNSQFAIRPLMTLDSNGDPAVVYSILSPNNADGTETLPDSFLEFVGWDRKVYAWKAPARIGFLGNDTPTGGGANNYSFARDAATNTWGVATLVIAADGSSTELRVYTSADNGQTWKANSAFVDSVYGIRAPSLALGGGNVYLSFFQDANGMRFLTGKLADAPDKWALSLAPLPAGADDYRQENHLVLDSAGKPGLAYWTLQGSYNSILAFWRPGADAAVPVIDSANIQNDFVEVKLTYYGTQARVMAQVVRDDQGPSGYERFFWVVAQNGDGFAAPVGLPSDGNSSLAYGAMTIGSSGQAAQVSARGGGNDGGVVCGNPKLTRSSDLVNWKTCSPFPAANEPYAKADWPQIAFASNDGLYIAMNNGDDQNPALWGIILWRER